MEYNKNLFQKARDKKVLHKVRKHWVVVSAALLMALGGGAAATTHTSHAAANNNQNGNVNNTNTLNERINSNLKMNNSQPTVNSNQQSNNSQASDNNNGQSITNQASTLHNRILANASRQGRVQNVMNAPEAKATEVNHRDNQVDSRQQGTAQMNYSAPETGAMSYDAPATGKTMGYNAPKVGDSNYYDADNQFKKSDFSYNPITHAAYTDYSDNGSSDFGAVTIKYVDPSDNNYEVGSAKTNGPAKDGTPFNINSYENNIPQTGDPQYKYGYHLNTSNKIDMGSNIQNFIGGQNQFLVINVQPNQAAATGRIYVDYEDKTNNQVISSSVQSDTTGNGFSQDGYIKNIPQGYKYDGFNTTSDNPTGTGLNQNAITQYPAKGQPKTLHIFVEPTALENYGTVNVVYNDKTTHQPVATKTIRGKQGSDINPSINGGKSQMLNFYVPTGYNFVSDANGDPTTFNNGTQNYNITVQQNTTPTPSVNKLDLGTITANFYQSDGKGQPTGSALNSITLNGKDGTNFDYNDAQNAVPTGYDFAANLNQNLKYNKNTAQTDTILVTKDPNYRSKVSSPVTNDKIQYMYVKASDPNLTPHTISGASDIPLTGMPGTTIDYTPYNQDVPQGYVYYGPGHEDSVMKSNETNTILVEPETDFAKPIYVHYMNEDGSDVDTAADKNAINGSYGQAYSFDGKKGTTNLTTSLAPVPNGYSLDANQDNVFYTNNQTQNITALVHGNSENSNPSNNDTKDSLNIKQVVYNSDNPNGDSIYTNTITVPVRGVTGQQFSINPKDYMPSPSSDYTVDSKQPENSPYNIELKTDSDGGIVQGNNGKNTTGKAIGNNNTITFNYLENWASGKVLYEDDGNGDSVVGQNTIEGKPGTNMSKFYSDQTVNGQLEKGLDNRGPYGYSFDSKAANSNNGYGKDNADTLVNGNTYVIYVKNNGSQPQPTPQPRQGYGYFTIRYGTNFDSNPVIYSTVKASGKQGTILDYGEYNDTANPHEVPDIYTVGASHGLTTSDISKIANGQIKYSNTPGTFDIDVTKNNSAYGKRVSDVVNYDQLDGNGNDLGTVTSVPAYGKDGYAINYLPFTQENIPTGYYYDGTKEYSSVYTAGNNSKGNPIATIYVMKASKSNGNNSNGGGTPGYNPDNVPGHNVPTPNGPKYKPGNADQPNNPTNPTNSGDYFPWSEDGTSDVPLTPSDNPLYPIANGNYGGSNSNYQYNSNDPLVPKGWEFDQKGFIPKGYVPAWVPDKSNDAGTAADYEDGFVPSDDVPDNYVPGYVPNGQGDYIPGYVPNDPTKTPDNSGKQNGGKNIPSYIPGHIPNGHGKTIPGYVPNVYPYADANTINIQYVNSYTHSDVGSVVPATGKKGSDLVLNKDTIYEQDIPSGYALDTDNQGNAIVSGFDSNDNGSNDPHHTGDITGTNSFQYGPVNTVYINLKQDATGTVVYEDNNNNNAPVGTAYINGFAGDPVQFTGEKANDASYMDLLPYGYSNPNPDSNNDKILNDGGTYVIHVDSTNPSPEPQPEPQKGYGYITVQYKNQQGNIVGTEQLVGQDNSNISSQDQSLFTKTEDSDGYIPYGYQLTGDNSTANGEVSGDKFGTTPQLITFNVAVKNNDHQHNDPNQPLNSKTDSDLIGYQAVVAQPDGSNNDVTIDYSNGANGKPVHPVLAGSSDDSHNPMLFKVRGQAGNPINYSPYQANVPSGFYYDGMGSHNNEYDNAHNNKADFDTILVKPIKNNNQIQTGTINIHYRDSNNSDLDDISLNGKNGQIFDAGYYENDIQVNHNGQNYVFDGAEGNSSDVVAFNNGPQNVTFKMAPNKVSQDGQIQVNFVKKSVLGDNSNPSASQLASAAITSGYIPKVTSQTVGTPFNIQQYEYDTPNGVSCLGNIGGDNVITYEPGQTQQVYVEVDA